MYRLLRFFFIQFSSKNIGSGESIRQIIIMKRFYKPAILALFLIFTAIASAADYDFQSDGIYYKVMSLDKMTVGVTKGDKNYTGKVVIPSTVSYNDRTFTVTQILGESFSESSVITVTIPETVTFIGYRAFSSTSRLSKIEFPTKQPLRIMHYAFINSALESVIIPDNVTELGEDVFMDCQNMVSVEIGEGIKQIPSGAFLRNIKLENIKLGSNITSIGDHAFRDCNYLTEISLPEGVKSIGMYAFGGCSRLTEIKLPEGIEKIESYMFKDCVRLTEITIPDNVREVQSSAFQGCTRLKAVIFGANIETIAESCIKDCTALTEIGIRNPEPPTCKAFTNKQYMDIALKVPEGAIADYKKAEPWKNFWSIEAIGSSGVDAVAADRIVSVRGGIIYLTDEAAAQGVKIYDTTGRCVYDGCDTVVSGLNSGIYIVKTKDTTVKVCL